MFLTLSRLGGKERGYKKKEEKKQHRAPSRAVILKMASQEKQPYQHHFIFREQEKGLTFKEL